LTDIINMHEFLTIAGRYAVLIFPWFAVGVVLSRLIDRYVNRDYLKRFSGPPGFKKLVSAQIIGMFSPLSIMSFLPVANGLIAWGVNPGLLLSFFIAERAYDLQSFFIISGLFGLKFALFNAAVIFLSLFASAMVIKKERINFNARRNGGTGHFWSRQGKMLGLVALGICFGALIRVLIPEHLITGLAGGYAGGFVSAIVLGFMLYLGPIVGNYPAAKAFSELGMSPVGTFAFLAISPIFNFIVILLFGAAVGFRQALKPILVYVLAAACLTIIVSMWL
jgi:uncharacterized membrane protein YraQ (UPF0718 family)